jgi:hypothetical protein
VGHPPYDRSDLREHPRYTTRELARAVGVPPSTVGAHSAHPTKWNSGTFGGRLILRSMNIASSVY